MNEKKKEIHVILKYITKHSITGFTWVIYIIINPSPQQMLNT